ncbi:2-hydroxychromene-2-carboxylate isomerase [Burkholderia cepacia]|uniref:2-hydroxychromene-2-carboxylate isomerase n=1 Tax=Burkholderia cepacia TaxID=292 RepID=UPI002AB5FC0C|nr:DsbA family protein [Burkholderia cepacia]
MAVQFVFDYRSIYSYLANTQMRTLGVHVDYQVVDIVAIMREVNNQPSPLCPPKARYSQMDAMRWAQIYNVPLRPNAHLLSAIQQRQLSDALLSRVGLAALQIGLFEQVNNALFEAVWAGTDDLVTEDGRKAFAFSRGFPLTLWEIADSQEVASQLAENNKRAIANGVFGAPTFFVGGEMYFGNDRLVFVRETLDRITARAAE